MTSDFTKHNTPILKTYAHVVIISNISFQNYFINNSPGLAEEMGFHLTGIGDKRIARLTSVLRKRFYKDNRKRV